MDRIILFRYISGDSLFHRTDARIKSLAFFAISILIFRLSLPGCLILLFCSIAAVLASRLQLSRFLVLLWPFYILFGLILMGKVLLDSSGTSRLTGLIDGAGIVFRMILLVFLGYIFTSTTTFEETRKSLFWFLRPFPGKTGFVVSTMLSLTLAFVPLLFIQAKDAREAQQARNIGASRNPFRSIKYFTVQIIVAAMDLGDHVGDAMESRCYSQKRTVYFPPVQPSSWIFVSAVTGAAAGAVTASLLCTF